ncbi:MAG: hypothetical protein KTR33_12335 [Gammaproteobacteria bacterium]|nr:hypothetical protein [Gammaproteobacteria bacterium]
MSFDPDNYRELLSVAADHTLELAHSHLPDSTSEERESHLLRELDDTSRVVAHYRVWTRQSLKPPYRRQRGWEKYSSDMTLLDREIRYSMPEPGITLH